jgi:hypothetical protein
MGRTVEYVLADGSRSSSRGAAVLADPAVVVATWRKFSRRSARYALGTAQHEADLATNEIDTEPDGKVTTGVYQLDTTEKLSALMPLADLTSLDDSTQVFATVSEARWTAICTTAGVDRDAAPPDVNAYMTIAHNQGLGACLRSIAAHGLDWEGYKARNIAEARAGATKMPLEWWLKVAAYGDDAISGGKYWRPEFDAVASVEVAADDASGSPGGDAPSTGFLERLVIFVVLAFVFYKVI